LTARLAEIRQLAEAARGGGFLDGAPPIGLCLGALAG
jgi:hypothetical protein